MPRPSRTFFFSFFVFLGAVVSLRWFVVGAGGAGPARGCVFSCALLVPFLFFFVRGPKG